MTGVVGFVDNVNLDDEVVIAQGAPFATTLPAGCWIATLATSVGSDTAYVSRNANAAVPAVGSQSWSGVLVTTHAARIFKLTRPTAIVVTTSGASRLYLQRL